MTIFTVALIVYQNNSMEIFNETRTTYLQIVLIVVVYGFFLLRKIRSLTKDSNISRAFFWFLVVAWACSFLALFIFTFWFFLLTATFFFLVPLLDVWNIYENPRGKLKSYKVSGGLYLVIPRYPPGQLILWVIINTIVWMIIMLCDNLVYTETAWRRIHLWNLLFE